jgi:DNA-binding transcriptional LysR family regulator
MKEFHPSAVDLNLLLLLHELLRTPSTVLVARRLGCTQSAVSHGLGRLRDALGDPLLVRSGRALTPTSRAEELRAPLAAWLRGTEQLLARSAPLEPSRLRRTFRVSTTDGAEALLLPGVMARLTQEAPGVALEVSHQADHVDRLVQSGDLDLALGFFMRELDGVLSTTLFEDELVTVAPSSWKGGCSLDSFLARPHVVVSPRALPGGIVDEALARLGQKRQVAARTPSFLAALEFAAAGLWLTMPRRFVPAARGFRLLRPPVELPAILFRMIFPALLQEDPAHRWFRGLVAAGAPGVRRPAVRVPPRSKHAA